MVSEVAYGNTCLTFDISYTDRRTLAIEVHPDLSIRVIAPRETSLDEIGERVLKKGSWIVRQFLFFEQFLPRTPQRLYVSGETHYYLGRQYILKVRQIDGAPTVKLKSGELLVFLPDAKSPQAVKNLLNKWYYTQATRRFKRTISECLIKFQGFNIEPPALVVKRMSKRWGSCTPQGKIILNPEIIKAPARCIEYVVLHELCHLVHPNHSKEFFELQSSMMPDWEKWKLRLEKMMV